MNDKKGSSNDGDGNRRRQQYTKQPLCCRASVGRGRGGSDSGPRGGYGGRRGFASMPVV